MDFPLIESLPSLVKREKKFRVSLVKREKNIPVFVERERIIILPSLRDRSHTSLAPSFLPFPKAVIIPITSLVKRQNFESLFFIFSPQKKNENCIPKFYLKKICQPKKSGRQKIEFFFSLLTSSLFLFFLVFFLFFLFFSKKNFFYFFCIFY